jgi:hypothetical protein
MVCTLPGREGCWSTNVEGRLAMKLRWIDSKAVSERDLSSLPALRKRTDGFLWLDISEWRRDRHPSQRLGFW